MRPIYRIWPSVNAPFVAMPNQIHEELSVIGSLEGVEQVSKTESVIQVFFLWNFDSFVSLPILHKFAMFLTVHC